MAVACFRGVINTQNAPADESDQSKAELTMHTFSGVAITCFRGVINAQNTPAEVSDRSKAEANDPHTLTRGRSRAVFQGRGQHTEQSSRGVREQSKAELTMHTL